MKQNIFSRLPNIFIILPFFVFLAAPASTNYQLKSYEFGGGGEKDMNSTNYQLEGIVGELNGEQSSTNFKANSGIFYVQMANTPGAPTFVNSADWYDRLHITVNTSNNPSDTTFAIAISTDDFATTQYVQNDNTVGSTLGLEDFQTYTAWGSGSGTDIIGLEPGTTYKVKVKARQGIYTEGPFGPTATASTSESLLAFDIDVASSDIESAAPYTVAFNNIAPGVTTSADKVWIDFETNATNGGDVYIKGVNGSLSSSSVSHSITSITGNLAAATEGWGVQGSTATQTTGGTLAFQPPFNGSSDTVGIISTLFQPILSSPGALTLGRASLNLKVKVNAGTPAGDDYSETLTIIAAGNF
jgi:hypothetical protein